MATRIPFGEWLPDQVPLGLQGAITATNVIPDIASYRPFPSLISVSNALGSRARGAIFATDLNNVSYNYAGDASSIYSLANNVYSVVGSGFTMGSDDYWEFVQWGNTVIGVCGFTTSPQQISLGAASCTAMAIGLVAKHITVMREFVVVGNISDSAAAAYRVRWCAINNPTSWTVDTATLADFQDLPAESGPVQRVLGGEYGVVMQQRAIWRMLFVGSPVIFQFDKVHNQIGDYVPQGAVRYQNFTFFLAEDGFYSFDGVSLNPIGRGKVDKFFFSDLDSTNIARINASIDPTNKLVLWAYPSLTNSGGNPDKILLYSWAFNRWTLVTGLNIELLMQSLQGNTTFVAGYTLDGLDVLGNLDTLALPLDQYDPSSIGTGGRIILSAFDSSHKLNLFTGSAMPATVDTAEFQFAPGFRAQITEVWPIATGLSASVTITVLNRNRLTESASIGTVASGPNATGFVATRVDARYMRIRMRTASTVNFEHLVGVDVEGTPSGKV